MNTLIKKHLNSLYGKMVQRENSTHTKNCTITITQTTGKHTTINTYKLDDYRVATAICNILDNVRYTERHYTTQDNTSLYDYADTDSIKENTENVKNI